MIVDGDTINNASITAEQSERTVSLVVSRCRSSWYPDSLPCTRSRVASV
jgi:hypothetical protein